MGPEINIDGDGHGENSDIITVDDDTGRVWGYHRSLSLRNEFVIPRSLTLIPEETSIIAPIANDGGPEETRRQCNWQQRHSEDEEEEDPTKASTERPNHYHQNDHHHPHHHHHHHHHHHYSNSSLNQTVPAGSRANAGAGGKREKLKALKENAVNALRHNDNHSAGKGRDSARSQSQPQSQSQSHSPAAATFAGGLGFRREEEEGDGLDRDVDREVKEEDSRVSPHQRSLSSKLAHPRTALKASLTHIVAGKLSTLNDPYIPQEAEVEFVEAHDERNEALRDGCREHVEDAEKKINELVKQRRNMQVNWIIDRHVTNVTVAPTKQRIIEKPCKADFIVRDEAGNPIIEFENGDERIDYIKWLGQYLLYATQDYTAQSIDYREPKSLSLEKARSSIERLFVSTAPWQEWLLHVFRVYRWENPHETFRWLCLYLVLWHYSYLITFLWFCVIYYTLRRYFYPETEIEDLRTALQRVRDTDRKACDLGDVIVHKGPQEWLLPLADTIGPWAQVQLGDLADLLEILENFYEWRAPAYTSLTLALLTSAFLFGLLASPEFCLKATYLGLGIAFFAWFPIASRYPRYRLVVSPVRWLFWNIPTHAEWAFQELSAEAEKNREKITARDVEKVLAGRPGEVVEQEQQVTGGSACAGGINTSSNSNGRGTTINPAVATADGPESRPDTPTPQRSTAAALALADQTLPRPAATYVRSFASFKCRCGHNLGHLVLHPSGLRFESLRKHRTIWSRVWLELVEIKKVKSSEPVGRLLALEGLEMAFVDGEKVRLGDMLEREEALKWILGYSRLKWRSNN